MIVACKISPRSIIFSLTIPIPETDLAPISRNAFSLWRGLNFFESSIRFLKRLVFKVTAAATTGPARGPRPTSSTPMIEIKAFFLKLPLEIEALLFGFFYLLFDLGSAFTDLAS